MTELIIKKKYSSPVSPICLVSLFVAKLVELLCMYKKIQIYVSKTLFHPNGGIFCKLFLFLLSLNDHKPEYPYYLFFGGGELWGTSLCKCTRVCLMNTTLADINLLRYLAVSNNNVMNNHVSFFQVQVYLKTISYDIDSLELIVLHNHIWILMIYIPNRNAWDCLFLSTLLNPNCCHTFNVWQSACWKMVSPCIVNLCFLYY